MTKRVRKTATRKLSTPGGIAGDAGPRLVGGEIDPVGPLNLFNEKIAAAEAVNRAIETKTEYDAAHPATPFVPPDRTPIGDPIDPGGPVAFDATKFVIDNNIRDRVMRKRWF
jgi:hypothetical protein